MPKKSEPIPGVSKRDLEQAIKRIRLFESKRVKKLREKSDEAEAAYHKFCETNATYLKLRRAKDEAHSERYQVANAENVVRRGECLRLEVMLRTKGPTAEVAKAIEEAIRTYSEYTGDQYC